MLTLISPSTNRAGCYRRFNLRRGNATTAKGAVSFRPSVERLDDRLLMDGYGIASPVDPAADLGTNEPEQSFVEQQDQLPGDANGDGRFDSLDVFQVIEAGKYLTDEPATWHDGDWNRDGVFDPLDIVFALSSGNYQHDSHPAMGSRANPFQGRAVGLYEAIAEAGNPDVPGAAEILTPDLDFGEIAAAGANLEARPSEDDPRDAGDSPSAGESGNGQDKTLTCECVKLTAQPEPDREDDAGQRIMQATFTPRPNTSTVDINVPIPYIAKIRCERTRSPLTRTCAGNIEVAVDGEWRYGAKQEKAVVEGRPTHTIDCGTNCTGDELSQDGVATATARIAVADPAAPIRGKLTFTFTPKVCEGRSWTMVVYVDNQDAGDGIDQDASDWDGDGVENADEATNGTDPMDPRFK